MQLKLLFTTILIFLATTITRAIPSPLITSTFLEALGQDYASPFNYVVRVQEEMADAGENSFQDGVVDVRGGQNFRVYNGIPVRKDADIRYTNGVGGEVERTRPAPVKVEEEGVAVAGVQGEARGLLEKSGITYGWGEWEPQMQYLEGLGGPAIMSVAHEDDLDSGAWAGEAPNEIAKDRFWKGCDPRYVEDAI